MIGEHISHFYIIRQLGGGGMGVVYEAQDTRLPRSVAIKVLKPTLLNDGEALKRFKREARLASSLNHPNICTIYEVEEAEGRSFIAMELLHGRSLKSRLTGTPLPLAEIIDIAMQVADALAAAHDQGIMHRDIAPGNVFLTDSGLVKLLDFGLAKHFPALEGDADTTDELTATGAVAGTLAYMSPEQLAENTPADRRSDLYSLGILLYQMAAGSRPFDVVPRNALVAAIQSDPHVPLRQVAPQHPAELERIIDKLLAKRPEDRYQSARTLRADLDGLRSDPEATTSAPRRSWDRHASAFELADGRALAPTAAVPVAARAYPVRRRYPMRGILGGVAALGLASAAWMALRPPAAPVQPTVIRYQNLIDQMVSSMVTITPNGRALVYTGSAEAEKPIMVQPLGEVVPHALRGTEGRAWPYVAHDGRRLALISDHIATYISIDSSGATDAAKGWRYGNGLWIGDSTYVTEGGPRRGLSRAVFGGGTPAVLTRPDTGRGESRHLAALILPGGRDVVFTISTLGGPRVKGPLAIASLDPSEPLSPHVLLGVEARRAFAFVDGWLLFTRSDGSAIMAVRLDVKHRRIIGTPVSVLEVSAGSLETAALADNGTLLYVRQPEFNSPVLVDSTGAVRQLLATAAGPFMNPRFSPDGRRLVVQKANPGVGNDVWVYDIATRTPTQLTTSGRALHPTWTSDGQSIVFLMAGSRELMSQSLHSGTAAGKVRDTGGAFAPTVAPGDRIVFQRHVGQSPWNVWSASLSGNNAPRQVVDDSLVHYMPAVSPNGRWLADVSSATGRNEVYVRPFPGPGPAVQVSNSGGTEPAWSPDGQRIYYRTRGWFMAAAITTTPRLAVPSRRQLFKDAFDGGMEHRNYDVARDGSGFLMITGGSSEAVVVLDWLPELRQRLARAR